MKLVGAGSMMTGRRRLARLRRRVAWIIVFLAVSASLSFAGTTVIHVATEGSGDIIKNGGTWNLNGAMVWNGSEWVVNNTWAHKFFVDTRTGERLKSYTSIEYSGTEPTGALSSIGAYAVTRSTYAYTTPAVDGGPAYAYQATQYLIHDAVSGREIILRSRGSGHGTDQAFFDIFLEDDVAGGWQTTALVGDPAWFTYPMRAAEAVNQPSVMADRTGDLHGALIQNGTYAADYFLDIGGGSDLGPAGVGKSYEIHTYAVQPSDCLVSNVGSTYTSDFNLKWMDSSGNLQMLRFLPAIVSETRGSTNSIADLSVSLSASADPVTLGSPLTYTMTVRNNGPDAATNINAIDVLPDDASFESSTPSSGSASEASGQVTWEIGTIQNGEQESLQIVILPARAGPIASTALASASPIDPDTSNNSALETTTVNVDGMADLTASITSRKRGDGWSFTVRIQNAGTVSAGHFMTSIYFSRNKRLDGNDTRISVLETQELGAGESIESKVRKYAPPHPTSRWYLIVAIDPGNEVPESDEVHNTVRQAM